MGQNAIAIPENAVVSVSLDAIGINSIDTGYW